MSMMGNDRKSFLAEVTRQISSKEAKANVEKELSYHLQEAKKYWLDKGLTDIEAEEKAVKKMGDPFQLGAKMNKLYRPKVDWLLLLLLVTVMILGFLPVLSMDSSQAELQDSFIRNRIIFGLLGIALAIGIMYFDYRKLKRWGWAFYLIGIAILYGLRLFPSYTINGEPYIAIPMLGLFNCWIALPFFLLAWAQFFQNKKLKIWQLFLLFIYSFYLFLMVPDLAISFIYGMTVLIMLWWSHLGKKTIVFITTMVSSTVLLGVAAINFYGNEYHNERFIPDNFADEPGFIYVQLKEQITGAKWFGNSANQASPLQDAYTDFALVGVTSHFGYAATTAVLLTLLLFVIRMGAIAIGTRNSYGKLLVVGALAIFSLQFFFNITKTFGIFPIISISLPFISYGWMPTILNAFLIGIVLSVYRRKQFDTFTEKGCVAK